MQSCILLYVVIAGTTCSVSQKSCFIEEKNKNKEKKNPGKQKLTRDLLKKSRIFQFLGVELFGYIMVCKNIKRAICDDEEDTLTWPRVLCIGEGESRGRTPCVDL